MENYLNNGNDLLWFTFSWKTHPTFAYSYCVKCVGMDLRADINIVELMVISWMEFSADKHVITLKTSDVVRRESAHDVLHYMLAMFTSFGTSNAGQMCILTSSQWIRDATNSITFLHSWLHVFGCACSQSYFFTYKLIWVTKKENNCHLESVRYFTSAPGIGPPCNKWSILYPISLRSFQWIFMSIYKLCWRSVKVNESSKNKQLEIKNSNYSRCSPTRARASRKQTHTTHGTRKFTHF